MTIHFHGPLGALAVALVFIGAATILTAIENWLRNRFTLDLRPLWHVIPRRFKVHLRWDRAGAYVTLGDGREGCILYLLEHDDAESPIALVQPYDENDDPDNQRPEWMELDTLTPAPRRSLRETWREMRAAGNGDA